MTKKTAKGRFISFVFPAYNEEENILEAISCAVEFAQNHNLKYEIIIVDDGSQDKTRMVVSNKYRGNKLVRLLKNGTNLGYGATVWKGLKASRGDLIFFTDSDLQFSIRELGKFIRKIQNCEAVVGYRKNRSEGRGRAFNAWGWKVFCRVLLGIKFKDIDCAFKLMKKSSISKIDIQSKGAAFSAELLYKMKKDNCRIEELPVAHLPRIKGRATGANLRVILRAILEMFKLSINK